MEIKMAYIEIKSCNFASVINGNRLKVTDKKSDSLNASNAF